MSAGRRILAVVAGVVVGGLVVFVVQAIGHRVYPPPEGIDPMDREAMAEVARNLPTGAFGFVVGAWVAGALAASRVASGIAAHAGPGWTAGLVLVAFTVVNLVLLPHPTWVAFGGVAGMLVAIALGARGRPAGQGGAPA